MKDEISTMSQHLSSNALHVSDLRRVLALLNVGLAAATALLAFVYQRVFGQFHAEIVIAFAAWCAYVQFSIRDRSAANRVRPVAFSTQNVSWGLFGTLIIGLQFGLPVYFMLV